MNKIIAILLCLFCTFVGSANADGKWVNCDRTKGYYQYFDSTVVQIGKDAQPGDLLGSWLTSSNPTAWTCSQNSSAQSSTPQMAVQGYPPYAIWGTTQVEGDTYNVYNTAVKAGLGYIARWRYTVKGQTSQWYPLSVANGVYQTPSELFTVAYDSGKTFNIGIDVQIRFVKTANSLTAGTTAVFDPMYLRHFQMNNGSSDYGTGSYMIAEFLAGGLIINPTAGTCTTSNVNVNLPQTGRSEFKGIGTVAARTAFTLDFKQCPAGLASISYSFTPTTSIIDNSNGVFSTDSSSNATGVGFQLLTDQETPVNFNTNYLLTTYDPSITNGNYTVPMKIGLYQTSESVMSGNVSGAVTFTLSYK